MTRHQLRAGAFVQAVVLWASTAAAGTDPYTDSYAQAHTLSVARPSRAVLELFHFQDKRVAPQADARLLREPRSRLYLEVDGAGSQARDWLHTAGFALFEQRDGEGRRSYQVMSGAVADDWPTIQLHARVGGPQLSAGLNPRREVPALGFTVPSASYTLELEGLKDRRLGTALMARMRWSDAQQRLQCAIALPVAVSGTPSVGVLLQLRIALDE
ncbi:MAG TPA: hypothetical protein VMW56_20860 [Candidatus Margulisiibacteriota bacterium]|nr:hypothetical protein [Candidatus Margulisiibacteriota bacterium]